jgi:D-alanine-D-alanine ligase
LRSGAAISEALSAAGHHVTQLDTINGLEPLLPQLQAADVVFPILHGCGGEDGTLQHFLEAYDIRYVGADEAASRLCFDKWRYTELLVEHHIPVPKTALVNLEEFRASELVKAAYVLKPNDGGSSIDTFIVRDVSQQADAAIEAAFGRHEKMLLQNLVEGVETTVGVLGSNALPVIEIIPPADAEFDYENKYNGATRELCPPEHVDFELQKQAQDMAVQIHQLTGCRDLSRTDIIVTQNAELYVLETNTLPGMTNQSLFPKAAAVSGTAMPELVDQLVSLALAR